jgi:acetyl esterase/lipase
MFTRLSIEVTTPSGVTVDHRLIAHDEPRGLLILLPGRGYTCDHPVLHYLRKAAADLGYDVLSVWYSFQVAAIPDDQVTMQQLAAEVDQAIREVLKRGYRHVMIAGKSLGTPLAVLHAQQAERLILLTPVGTAVQDAGSKPTLAIIGTADPVYDPDAINASAGSVEWLVLEGLDHGLEAAGDWATSLDALHQITAACVEFLS